MEYFKTLLSLLLLTMSMVRSLDPKVNDEVLIIDKETNVRDIFKCSSVHAIGPYNEYYVVCRLDVPNQQMLKKLEIINSSLDITTLAPVNPSILSIHVEAEFPLNKTATSLFMTNSTIQASSIYIEAANVSLDRSSVLNVSNMGLKFGPGYNSWFDMGGSYGGIGGAALSRDNTNCNQLPENEYIKPIGDISGKLMDFRGYGSGGGNDQARGGGRIELMVTEFITINGSFLANGANVYKGRLESAGSGGTIIIRTSIIRGIGFIEACGGEPSGYDKNLDIGGGGGGGGGRIVLEYTDSQLLASGAVKAFGGGTFLKQGEAQELPIQWCQLGADGTILKLEHQDKNSESLIIGSAFVKGKRLQQAGLADRVRLFGCTPLYIFNSRGSAFIPSSVAHLFISNGAVVCGSYIYLPSNTSLSSIVIDSGSILHRMRDNHTVHLSAGSIDIQGEIGPTPENMKDTFRMTLHAESDVSLSNANIIVTQLDVLTGELFAMDKYSVLQFSEEVTINSKGDVSIAGFVNPQTKYSHVLNEDSNTISMRLLCKNKTNVALQPTQLGTLTLEVIGGDAVILDIPFEAPFLSVLVSAYNITVNHLSVGNIKKCEPITSHAKSSVCTEFKDVAPFKFPYLVGLFASKHLSVGQIVGGSVLLCAGDSINIFGNISSDGLGCSSGMGPGNSSNHNEASGGAGHGGKGGNVQPGNIGGGEQYDNQDTSYGFDFTWPVWPGSGAASGDSPDEFSGGFGGGLVHIKSRVVHFEDGQSVSARGSRGLKHGGGGSGGSIVVFVNQLRGRGLIDGSGGDSINSNSILETDRLSKSIRIVWEPLLDESMSKGGGGAGGIVRIAYHGNESADGGENFFNDGGKILSLGGRSTGGENGSNGALVGSNCTDGRGGVYCLPCEAGTHSPANFSSCKPCDPGTFTNVTGASKCEKCAPGTFNPNFGKRSCRNCSPGSFASSDGSTKCILCSLGSYSDQEGQSKCVPCPIGSIATSEGSKNCTVCGIGETTTKTGSLTCMQCHDKPEHAAYNMRGNCSYACEKGRNGIDCLTPFERFVKPIGGALGFVILVFSLTSMVFAVWGLISYRRLSYQQRRFAEYKAQIIRDQLSLSNLTHSLTPRLTDQDLDYHIVRLYFLGNNGINHPWHLKSQYIPHELKDAVYENSYTSFVETCNEMLSWKSSTFVIWAYRVLLVTIPPLAVLFIRKEQMKRIEKLNRYVCRFGAGFFRDMNFRAHGAQLKLGFSADFSLAYLDIIVNTGTNNGTHPHPTNTSTVFQKWSQFMFLVSGSGSFFRPYHVDTNDVLVRAVPNRLQLLKHNFWLEFIAEVNQKLRIIPQPSTPLSKQNAANGIKKLIQFVKDFSSRHEKDGFEMLFGRYDVGDESVYENFDCIDEEEVEDILESYENDKLKFGFRVLKVPQTDNTPLQFDLCRPESTIHLSLSRNSLLCEDGGKDQDEFCSQTLLHSQIRMEALFAGPLSPKDHSHLKESLLVQSQSFKSSSCRCIDFFQKIESLFRPIFPYLMIRNVPARKSRLPWRFPILILLLICDFIMVFWILMDYFCIQVQDPTAHASGCSRSAFFAVLSILPGACIGSPLLGLLFLNKKSSFLGRLFAAWNCASVVNIFVAFAYAIYFQSFVHESIFVVVTVGVALKYLEKEMALQCIAQYESERPLRGWRGLYTTKDWYDSAYTPLVHHYH